MICILGRNGMGKTTTLRTIMGILRSGPAGSSSPARTSWPCAAPTARAGLGFIPEERGIFASLSVEENPMLPPKVAEGGMSVAEIYDLFPNLKERRTSPGTKLSGASSRCWRSRASRAPARAACCWTSRPRGWPRSSSRPSARCW